MFNSIEEYGKAWVAIRKSPSFYKGKEPTDYELGRLEGVEDFLDGYALLSASQALRDKVQLADIHMSRDASKVRG